MKAKVYAVFKVLVPVEIDIDTTLEVAEQEMLITAFPTQNGQLRSDIVVAETQYLGMISQELHRVKPVKNEDD